MNHDENAIRGLINTFVAGWNSADGSQIAGVFTQSADFTAITGLHARGKEMIARGHDEILATIYRGTKLSSEIELIDFLRPDLALVNVKFVLRRGGENFFPGVPHTSCGIVALRSDGAWRIACFRNMVPFSRPVAGPIEREVTQASALASLGRKIVLETSDALHS